MSNLENILSEFTSFIDKSAAVMNTPAGGAAPQPAQAPVAGQPTVRANETHPNSTLKSPVVPAGLGKVPTSNAAPKKIDFKSF